MARAGIDDETKPDALDDSARATLVRVLLLWDGGGAKHWAKPGATLTIGRSSECDVRVDHDSVSRVHARVTTGDAVTIEDLDSSNGVRVRGARIAPGAQVTLSRGDPVELGSVVLVVQPPVQPGVVVSKATFRPGPARPSLESPMAAVDRMIDLVAQSDISVLLLGETGAGKGATAQRIHEQSVRASRPLLRLNCPAFPEALLESELFGYERGAFSGAATAKPGLIESAEGGTLFLDEIAEIGPATQAKLLGVLDDREVLRLGSVKPHRIDVRFVAATNRDLELLVRAGVFRSDLYFRLNGITITVPPLRARLAELPRFAAAFLAEACKGRRAVPSVSEEAMGWLVARDWPGNLRELRNVMGRAAVLCQGDRVLSEHLAAPPLSQAPTPSSPPPNGAAGPTPASVGGGDLRREVETLERRRVEEALAACDGNQTRAAKMLGLTRRALIGRIEAYGLPRPRKPT